MKKVYIFVILFIFSTTLSGCLFGPESKETAAIDPPQKNYDDIPNKKINKNKENEATSGTEVYFLSSSGYVVPYTLKDQLSPKDMISKLVEGSAKDLPKGHVGLLPKGTQVKEVTIVDNVVRVDFSKDFLKYDVKNEEKILDALVWTATSIPGVKEVNLFVEGKALEVMPKGKSPSQNLTRKRGINLEVTKGVNLGESMPVVLYYLGQTEDNLTYYVPITRLVQRADNVSEAAMSELVRGPDLYSKLINPIDTNTDLLSVKIKGELATADFGEQLLQYGQKKSISQAALDVIVYSLVQNSNVKQVEVKVNGKGGLAVFGSEQKNLDKPVLAPRFINKQSF